MAREIGISEGTEAASESSRQGTDDAAPPAPKVAESASQHRSKFRTQLDANFSLLLQDRTEVRTWGTNGKKSSSSYQPPHQRYLTKKTLCRVEGNGCAATIPCSYSNRSDVLPSWRPSELPALPPKLIFFGEYRERCADAQPHIRTAWVVTRIYVNYDTRTQGVTASVHDQDFAMTLTNAMGMPLEPWDLHVGAVLNILDRRVTLRGADLATRLWLVSQADRLVRERKLLERELNKFTHVTAIQEDHCRHYVRTADDWFRTYHNPTDPKFSSGGKMNLRRLMQESEELRIRLAQFRRRLPQYGGLVPPEGVRLTGPFDVPLDWHGDRHSDGTQTQQVPTIIVDDNRHQKPEGYLKWLESIPLASSAAFCPTGHMAKATVFRKKVSTLSKRAAAH